MGKTIYGYCENKGKHELDTVKVSATQPITNEKVWIQKAKNLFNISKRIYTATSTSETSISMANGTFNASASTATAHSSFFFDNLKVGEKYTISWRNATNLNSMQMFQSDINKTQGTQYFRSYNTTDSITFEATTEYVSFNILATGTTVSVENIQIEQGSTATEYEAYVEPKIYVKNDNDVYEEFYSNVVVKDDFAVITGNFSIEANTQTNIDNGLAKEGSTSIDFPSGFDKNNCVVVSFGCKYFENKGYSYGTLTGTADNEAIMILLGNAPASVTLGNTEGGDNENKIIIYGSNYATDSSKNLYYKLVLMKI